MYALISTIIHFTIGLATRILKGGVCSKIIFCARVAFSMRIGGGKTAVELSLDQYKPLSLRR